MKFVQTVSYNYSNSCFVVWKGEAQQTNTFLMSILQKQDFTDLARKTVGPCAGNNGLRSLLDHSESPGLTSPSHI